ATESAGVSETARNPVKTLLATSDIVGDSANPLNLAESPLAASDRVGVSERNFPADLLMLSEMVDRFSASPLSVVAPLETMSEMVGDSASPLNPVKSLLAASERVGVSERNLPADLLMVSVMPARLSDMLLNPVKTLLATSDIVGDSASPLNPVKSLLAASERVGVSERNLPADLLMVSVMPARLSDKLLNPVKTL